MAAEITAGTAAELAAIDQDIEGYLARHEQKELCRFVAVGSVDDGKSTLIGRLLHDTQGIYEDQLAAVKKASKKGDTGNDDEIDFALFTDGLKAEREQGITIDVAYRYFSTEKRKFIIADTPGHVQYTRNMATGASTADIAIILLDARLGVLPQSRRHAYIALLLGIRHLLVAVNKMDLVDYAEEVFDRLRSNFSAFASKLGFADIAFFPISAKKGDNVVVPSARTPWFGGTSIGGEGSAKVGTILAYLESVPIGHEVAAEPFRYPVQYVLRPNQNYRGFAGQIASGVVKRGDEIVVLPSGRRTRVRAIDTWAGEVESAEAPLSITIRLEDEVDVSRGDMLAHPHNPPAADRRFDAMLVWLSERAYDAQRSLLLKHTSRMVPARIERVHHRTDLETLDPVASTSLSLNDIGRVTVRVNRPLFCDPYLQNRGTGAFILVDALSNDTVAAGMIIGPAGAGDADAATGAVTAAERQARLGHRGAALFVAADPALARAVERALFDRGFAALVVDARELSADALGEVVVRCAAGCFAVVIAGATTQVEADLIARLGADRCVTATAASAASLADDLAALLTLPDE